jgi:MFS family permease
VSGALLAGARGRVDSRLLVWAATAFGVLMLLAAAAPTLPLQVATLIPLGAVSVTFAAGVNSALQIAVDPAMRGRVMALYSVVFLGSTPIGAPVVGWLAEVGGPRAGLVAGAVAALIAAAAARMAFRRAGVGSGAYAYAGAMDSSAGSGVAAGAAGEPEVEQTEPAPAAGPPGGHERPRVSSRRRGEHGAPAAATRAPAVRRAE